MIDVTGFYYTEDGELKCDSDTNWYNIVIRAIDNISLGTRYIQSVISDTLIKEKGIAVTSDFNKLSHQLAKCGMIFGVNDKDRLANMDLITPKGSLSKFHMYNIRYYIENNLPRLLNIYLDSYDLATDMNMVNTILSQIPKRALDLTNWLPLLFSLRCGDYMQASVYSSFFDSDSATLQNFYSKESNISILGTLMYSSSSIK